MDALNKGVVLNKRYEIINLMGQGGFGITYQAYDRKNKRNVTIKELFPKKYALRDKTDLKRVQFKPGEEERFLRCETSFHKESEVLRELSGTPGLPSFFDSFYENGTSYLVLSYIEGESLREYVGRRRGRIKAQEAFSLLVRPIETLIKVHERGILHRDISPDNLLLTGTGEVMIIDFGSACMIGDSKADVFVRPGYGAPEMNELKRQGFFSDVYSICAVFCFLISGQTIMGCGHRKTFDDLPRDLSRMSLSKTGQNVLLHGLALEPEIRIQNMELLLQEFSKAFRLNRRSFFGRLQKAS